MKMLLFNLFIVALCYSAGYYLAVILAPVFFITDSFQIVMLAFCFAMFFFVMSLFIRDHFN